jgi:hypothetical protein
MGQIDRDRHPYIDPLSLDSYARPPPESCRILMSHGSTQAFDSPLPLSCHMERTPLRWSLYHVRFCDAPPSSDPLTGLGCHRGSSRYHRDWNCTSHKFHFIGTTIHVGQRYPEPSAPLLRIEDAAPMSWEELRPLVEDKLGLQNGKHMADFSTSRQHSGFGSKHFCSLMVLNTNLQHRLKVPPPIRASIACDGTGTLTVS